LKVVGIPARYGSSRFPGKLLRPLGGKPVVRWVVEAALKSSADRVVLITDDGRIKEAVSDLCEVRMTPTDLPSGTDRLAYALRDLPGDALVMNLQGDEPFIRPEIVDALFSFAEGGDAHIYTLAHPSGDGNNPHRVKVVLDGSGFALYFSRSPIPYGAEEYLIHVGVYVYPLENLLRFSGLKPSPLEKTERLEQLRALYYGWKIKVLVSDYEGFGIDTPEDLRRAEDLLFRSSGTNRP